MSGHGNQDSDYFNNRAPVYGPFNEAQQKEYRVCADCPEPLGRGCDCPKSSTAACGVLAGAEPLSDEQVKVRAAKAGLRWIGPMPDEDGGEGYPGGFDMSSLDEIRALLTAGVSVPDHQTKSQNSTST